MRRSVEWEFRDSLPQASAPDDDIAATLMAAEDSLARIRLGHDDNDSDIDTHQLPEPCAGAWQP